MLYTCTDGKLFLAFPGVQVNYFPSRFDPVRHSEKYPYQNMKVSGNREKMCIAKENNFAQAGARWRSFDPARQDRFINRIAGMLTAPRVTQVCAQVFETYPATLLV